VGPRAERLESTPPSRFASPDSASAAPPHRAANQAAWSTKPSHTPCIHAGVTQSAGPRRTNGAPRPSSAVSESTSTSRAVAVERKGFVASRYGDATPVRGGRPKRFFRATPRGVRAAREALHLMQSMTAGLDEVPGR
jgi:hypothetical protein